MVEIMLTGSTVDCVSKQLASRVAFGVLTGLLLCSCSSLEVSRLPEAAADPKTHTNNYDNYKPIAAWPYSLGFVRYEATFVYKLSSCDGGNAAVDVSASVTATNADDPAAQFMIKYDSPSGFTKTVDLKVEYWDGRQTLKSINGTVKDETGPMIVNTVTALAKVAAAAAGGGKSSQQQPPPRITCTAGSVAALDKVKEKEIALDAATKRLHRSTVELTSITSSLATLSSARSKLSEHQVTEIYAAMRQVGADQLALDQATLEYSDAGAAVTATSTVLWPPNGTEWESAVYTAPDAVRRWFDKAASMDLPTVKLFLRSMTAAASTDPNVGRYPDNVRTLLARLKDDERGGGIVVRNGVPGRLMAQYCQSLSSCVDQKLDERTLPQLGLPYRLTLESGPFDGTTLSATFSEDGALASAGYGHPESAGANLTSALANAAAQVGPAVQTVRDAAVARVKRETDLLNAKVDREKARTAYIGSFADITQEQTAVIEADTALKNATKANLEAAKALDQARAGNGGAAASAQ